VARHGQVSSTLIHSDVHLRNWYISPEGKMGLTDWQATCRGHWSRDLAYTIVCAVPVNVRRSVEKELIAYYLDRVGAYGGQPASFDEAWLIIGSKCSARWHGGQ
jgi:aminoglycoside phosphotransferase (APT) family kinase protein